MMPVLRFEGATLGYCSVCGLPAQVGQFSLTGWKHGFFVCSRCLQRLCERVLTTLEGQVHDG